MHNCKKLDSNREIVFKKKYTCSYVYILYYFIENTYYIIHIIIPKWPKQINSAIFRKIDPNAHETKLIDNETLYYLLFNSS